MRSVITTIVVIVVIGVIGTTAAVLYVSFGNDPTTSSDPAGTADTEGVEPADSDSGEDTTAAPSGDTSQSAVGPLYDPVVAGEPTPPGYRPILERDTIAPVYEPEFVAADAVDWTPSSLVLGVALEGEAKAYPITHLNFREMVIDELADQPIVVSWCPLCGTAMVHSRMIDGEVLSFGNQGHLWQNAMTFYDHATGSIWSQPLGEAILGPMKGTRLELLPSTLTSWDSWMAGHPDTLALDAPGEPSSYRLSDMLLVIDFSEETVAYPFSALRGRRVVNDVVGGVELAIVLEEGDLSSWSVLGRTVSGQTLTLRWEGTDLVDEETGTIWDSTTGFGVDGDLSAETLPMLPALTVFPADFDSFWPDGEIRDLSTELSG